MARLHCSNLRKDYPADESQIVNHLFTKLVTVRSSMKLILVVLTVVALYSPGIRTHWQTTQDPYFVPYDAVAHIPPFFKFERHDPIPTTYVKEYYLNTVSPLLYKWSVRIGAQIGDVRSFQLGMMYLTYAFFVGVVGRLGWVLGGAALSFAMVALTVTAWIFIGLGFIGGTPRMYAYPLISLVLYSLIRDRPYLLGVTTVLGGTLYPIVAAIGALCLTGWMLLRPLFNQSVVSQWGLPRRLAILALTGTLTTTAMIPLIVGARSYGRRIVATDIINYPEAGPEGTYRSYDQVPYKLFGHEWIAYFVGPMYSHGDPIVPWLNIRKNLDYQSFVFALAVTVLIVLFVILRGMGSVLKEDQSGGGIRLISFFVVCGLLHVIAWLASPHLHIPTRYFMFSLPFLVTIIFPWCLYTLLRRMTRIQSSHRFRNVAFLGVISIYLMAFGGRGNVDFSTLSVQKPAQPLFDAIAALPKDVIIAGWPNEEMRKIEYITRRNAFLTSSVHQVLHLNFVKTMHARMDALFEAYLSTDPAPLYELRQNYGVTHLLIETRHFTDPTHPPEYFAPWKFRIQPRLAEIKGKEYLMNSSLHDKAAIFNQNGFILLDLGKLS